MGEAELDEYAGMYQNAPDYLRLELAVEDGKLFLKQVGQPGRTDVQKIGTNSFSAGGTEFLLSGGCGNAVYMHIAAHALRKLRD